MPVHRFQNPPTIHAPRGYTHVVETSSPGRTIYIAGQVGMAPDGKIAGDFREPVDLRRFADIDFRNRRAMRGGGMLDDARYQQRRFHDQAAHAGHFLAASRRITSPRDTNFSPSNWQSCMAWKAR